MNFVDVIYVGTKTETIGEIVPDFFTNVNEAFLHASSTSEAELERPLGGEEEISAPQPKKKKQTKAEAKYTKSAAEKWKMLAKFFVCDIPVEHEFIRLADKLFANRDLDTDFVVKVQTEQMLEQQTGYPNKSGILCAFEVLCFS